MKPITIDTGIILHHVTLIYLKVDNHNYGSLDVISDGNYIGTIYLDDYKLKYVCTIIGTKHYKLVEVSNDI